MDSILNKEKEVNNYIMETSSNMLVLKGWTSVNKHVHQFVKNLLIPIQVESCFAGRMKHFLKNMELLTNDKNILQIGNGGEIPLLSKPHQNENPKQIKTNAQNSCIVQQEVPSMLEEGAINTAIPKTDQVLSNIFLRPMPGGEIRPIKNLRETTKFIPLVHFKMESLKDLKNIRKVNDLMCKIDLKDAYFTVTLSKHSRKYVRFQWDGMIYEFMCLAFGLGPARPIFTKLMKVPVAILRRLDIRLIIYLGDILLMGDSLEAIEMARDKTLFLMEQLGFMINLKKSVLEPSHCIEFLGMKIDSKSMTIHLPSHKTTALMSLCEQTMISKQITLRDLSKMIGKLRSTAPAITPASLKIPTTMIYKNPENKNVIRDSRNPRSKLHFGTKMVDRKHKLDRGETTFNPITRISNILGCSQIRRLRATSAGLSTVGMWTAKERVLHINTLELMAAKFAIKTKESVISAHTDRQHHCTGLFSEKSKTLTKISKEIWQYILQRKIALTAEWIPSKENFQADRESRNAKDPSEWILYSIIFRKICKMVKLTRIQ